MEFFDARGNPAAFSLGRLFAGGDRLGNEQARQEGFLSAARAAGLEQGARLSREQALGEQFTNQQRQAFVDQAAALGIDPVTALATSAEFGTQLKASEEARGIGTQSDAFSRTFDETNAGRGAGALAQQFLRLGTGRPGNVTQVQGGVAINPLADLEGQALAPTLVGQSQIDRNQAAAGASRARAAGGASGGGGKRQTFQFLDENGDRRFLVSSGTTDELGRAIGFDAVTGEAVPIPGNAVPITGAQAGPAVGASAAAQDFIARTEDEAQNFGSEPTGTIDAIRTTSGLFRRTTGGVAELFSGAVNIVDDPSEFTVAESFLRNIERDLLRVRAVNTARTSIQEQVETLRNLPSGGFLSGPRAAQNAREVTGVLDNLLLTVRDSLPGATDPAERRQLLNLGRQTAELLRRLRQGPERGGPEQSAPGVGPEQSAPGVGPEQSAPGVGPEQSAAPVGTRDNPATPQTDPEFDALPSGTVFIDDDGILKVKQ